MENLTRSQTRVYLANFTHWFCSVGTVLVAIVVLSLQVNYAQCPHDCINFNTLFGKDAGDPMMGGKSNSFFGQNAGKNNTSGDANSFFGQDAGLSNTEGDSNSFFGFGAGSSNTTGSWNSFFGQGSGFKNTLGFANSFFGRNSGRDNTDGDANSFFGQNAGHDNTSGSFNSFFGVEAGGLNRTGNSNSFFGDDAGYENTAGKQNSFFGRSAGNNNEGSANSFFGYRAGYQIYSGDSVICIGANSGPSSSVNNRLYIDVRRSDDPLIYGEFDNDFVRINGTFEVTAGLSNPSSISLKENLVPVDPMVVLNKIALLDIQEWSYKDTPHVRHIGPIAEDFYAAFNLGRGSKTISTIDADGVALLAIQALRKQVDALKAENQTLRSDHLEMQRTIDALCARVAKIESSQSSLE